MRSFFLSTSFILLFFFVSKAQSSTQSISTFTDTRDDEVYRIMTFSRDVGLGVIHNHIWMIDNLRYKTEEGSYYHDGLKTEEERKKYGRLYTWKAVKEACPKGWHLPTDVEWQRLMHQFSDGGLIRDEPKKIYKELLEGGSSSFSALLGGDRYSDGEFINLGEYGNYWSATEHDADGARDYGFDKADGKVSRNGSNRSSALSCRCIKD